MTMRLTRVHDHASSGNNGRVTVAQVSLSVGPCFRGGRSVASELILCCLYRMSKAEDEV